MRIRLLAALAGTLAALTAAPVLAQDYPRRPVTIVAPFPAGSVTDGVARVVADSLSRDLKQNVIVENKPGQEGAIAARAAARAEPDGYTMLIGGNSTHSASLALYKALAYDPVEDFQIIGGVAKIPLLLMVNVDSPAADFPAFLKVARDASRPISFGSGATSTRAAGELLKARAGFGIVNVPYRGIPVAVTDLLGQRIDAVFSDPATVLGMIEERKLKPLAVTSAKRVAKLPDVPTIAEGGFPGFEVVPWLALFVPAKTPAPIVARLREALDRMHADPAVLAFMAQIAIDPFHASPQQVSAFLADDIRLWADFVRTAGIEKN